MVTLTPNLLSPKFLHLSSGYTAAYQEIGEGSPILFLHGFLGSGHCWRSLVELLKDNHRCICLDMLGFGESSKPMIRYNIAKLMAFVREVVDALNLDPCIVVGHSLGGWVSAAYAIAYPDSVRGLILVAPAGIRDDSFCGRYDALRPLLWKTPVVDWAFWLAQPIAAIAGKQDPYQKFWRIRRDLNANPAARSFIVDRIRPEDAIDTVEKEIDQLTLPTLVIAGEHDNTIPMWHSQTYATEISSARLVVIANADHSLPQDYAQEMTEAIAPFLDQCEF